ncbi:hypothetical protein [Nitratireductor indicus]|uniref:CopG family transcriptional regulator n=1 Tax=Nitratireductor indicus C115 TaxID=1231190 RepID=K2PS62_9HYPH|nr:hypothetical protein [Nitratireductor indicus]EKF43912.1 hypothetical protein NA8A_03850 [Nitratireductor indicus C115]MDS1135503.1 hypothetical protein [Nitratireductor indicus]SFQ14368.1 hypothetical protein SAMN05216176_101546 [Nitratireductor indicus]
MSDKIDAGEQEIILTVKSGIVTALDRFIASEGHGQSRAEATEGILRSWLIERGFAQPQDDGDEGRRPEELNAANDD